MTCVSQGTTNYDVDGDRDNDYCYEREWWDCNTDSQCPSNKWCTGSGGSPRYDCVPDLGLCSACSRSNQCQSGTTCISGKCRVATTEVGLCFNGLDDDCDGVKDCQGTGEPECNCCKPLWGSCSNNDAQCCGAIPCDYPNEAGSTTCGCPTGFDWIGETCVFSEADCTAPPSDCDTNPYQAACIRYSPIPFSSTQGCCEYGSYGGTTFYDWDVAHITTY